MAWMLETFARRADPKTLWPGVHSVAGARGAAVWALGRLCGPEEGRALARRRAAREIDADVIAEWRDAFPS
jgi:hypothetical protein